jgi:hypothetical protein
LSERLVLWPGKLYEHRADEHGYGGERRCFGQWGRYAGNGFNSHHESSMLDNVSFVGGIVKEKVVMRNDWISTLRTSNIK